MLYREIIAVCSEIHTEHINTLCGQNVELLNVKLVVHIVTTGLYSVNTVEGCHMHPCSHTDTDVHQLYFNCSIISYITQEQTTSTITTSLRGFVFSQRSKCVM
jgi:hypothetical protein